MQSKKWVEKGDFRWELKLVFLLHSKKRFEYLSRQDQSTEKRDCFDPHTSRIFLSIDIYSSFETHRIFDHTKIAGSHAYNIQQ